MTVLVNSFEGGTSGTTISSANSGGSSGNAFDTVTIGTSATLTFDNTHAAHGSLAAELVTPATVTNAFLQWGPSLTGSTIPQVWFRIYCYLPSLPSATLRLIGARNGSTLCGSIGINSTGHVITADTSSATQTTSTNVVPTSTWFRLEGYFIGSATAGQIQVEIFTTSMDEITPDETNTTGASINTGAAIAQLRFGNPSNVASYTMWLDDIGASTTGYMGPAALATSLTTPNVALAAPLITPSVPGVSVNLTTPNLSLAAPLLTPPSPSFPLGPLGLECDLYLSSVWTDTSSYVYQRDGSSPPVGITRGKPNESSGITPAEASWEWNNQAGQFSPRNPTSPYYGQLIRNTPIRWSVNALSNYLRLESSNSSRAFVSSNATISPTGSIDVRLSLRLTDWQGCVLAARYDNSQPSWYLLLNADGTLTFSWFNSGGTQFTATSNVMVPYTSGDTVLRVTLNATNGNVIFYTASTIGGTYTQLGNIQTPTSGSSTTLRAGNAPLVVGWSANLSNPQMYGRVYEFQFYSGIAGTLVADAIFSAQNAGATTWADAQGNTWTVSGGAEISARDYRFHGQMSSQPPTWDKTAKDMAVSATAGGPLRIIGQGSPKSVASPMYRGITTQTGTATPIAYWPMEDGSSATNFGPAIGSNPMTWNLATPLLASNNEFACSSALPQMNNAALQGVVPPYAGLAPWNSTGTNWAVRFLADFTTLPASGSVTVFQVDITGGIGSYAVMGVDSTGKVILNIFDANDSLLYTTNAVTWPVSITQPMWWSIEAQPSGSNVLYSIVSLQPGASTAYAATLTSGAGSAGYVTLVAPATFGNWSDLVIGHVSVQASSPSLFSLAGPLDAWQGEAAAVRYARLCGENGWPARILGPASVSAPMGNQSITDFQSLLQECEKADMGQMFETRQVLGLGYRTLVSILNQAQSPDLNLSYAAATLGGAGESTQSGLAPTYDDLLTNNDWTLIRGNAQAQGSSYRAYLNDGTELSITVVGDYPESETINLYTDSQLPDAANWLVHIGTVNEARWAAIPFNLARSALAASLGALMALEIGDAISITSIPTVISYDPVGQIAIGFEEDLGAFYWWIQTNNTPSSPYSTAIFDDLVYGRLDTDGSTLTSSVSSTATSISVTTTSSSAPVWTTNAGDLPFDIVIAGERMTVTNVSSSSSPQTLTVTRSVNGVVKAQTAGSDVRLFFPPILAIL